MGESHSNVKTTEAETGERVPVNIDAVCQVKVKCRNRIYQVLCYGEGDEKMSWKTVTEADFKNPKVVGEKREIEGDLDVKAMERAPPTKGEAAPPMPASHKHK